LVDSDSIYPNYTLYIADFNNATLSNGIQFNNTVSGQLSSQYTQMAVSDNTILLNMKGYDDEFLGYVYNITTNEQSLIFSGDGISRDWSNLGGLILNDQTSFVYFINSTDDSYVTIASASYDGTSFKNQTRNFTRIYSWYFNYLQLNDTHFVAQYKDDFEAQLGVLKVENDGTLTITNQMVLPFNFSEYGSMYIDTNGTLQVTCQLAQFGLDLNTFEIVSMNSYLSPFYGPPIALKNGTKIYSNSFGFFFFNPNGTFSGNKYDFTHILSIYNVSGNEIYALQNYYTDDKTLYMLAALNLNDLSWTTWEYDLDSECDSTALMGVNRNNSDSRPDFIYYCDEEYRVVRGSSLVELSLDVDFDEIEDQPVFSNFSADYFVSTKISGTNDLLTAQKFKGSDGSVDGSAKTVFKQTTSQSIVDQESIFAVVTNSEQTSSTVYLYNVILDKNVTSFAFDRVIKHAEPAGFNSKMTGKVKAVLALDKEGKLTVVNQQLASSQIPISSGATVKPEDIVMRTVANQTVIVNTGTVGFRRVDYLDFNPSGSASVLQICMFVIIAMFVFINI